MKRKIAKIISLCLCMVLFAGGALYAFAANDDKVVEDQAEKNNTEEQLDEDKQQQGDSSESNAYKDETVYVLADADGTIQKIIVSDWIKNTLSSDKINDVSELENIENVKGDEEYTLGGDNVRVWDARGNDIYYQGTIEKELPVGLKVSYKLDGETVSPDELAGKSGKVTIRFDYENNRYENVKINGKDEKIYVPFAMLTGMILDNDTFSNVEVSNGKVINDGDRTVVIGLALPGLEEDLGINKDKIEDKLDKKFEIPSYVEITADVNNFSLGMTVTVATNSLINNIDTEKIDDITDLSGSIDELSDAMAKLLDGSSALYNGLCTLLDKSKELINGINQLADGVAKLKDGAYALDEGTKKLSDGAAALSSGLDTLSSNNDKLNDGAKKVFEALLSTAETQLKAAGLSVPALTIDNYASVLNGIIDSLDNTKIYNQALEQVTAAVEEKRDYIKSQVADAVRTEVEAGVTSAVTEQVKAQVTEAVKEQVLAEVTAKVRENVEEQVILAVTGMNKASYNTAVSAGRVDTAAQNAVKSAITQKMASEEITALISSNTDKQMQSEEVSAIIAQKVEEQMKTEQIKNTIKKNTDLKMTEKDIQALIEQNTEAQIQKAISENMAGEEVQSKIASASEGAKSVISLKASLDDYNAFYLGLMDYTAGVAQAASGASDLKNGASELKNGTNNLYNGVCSLYDGILTMKNGVPALVDGVTQLKDGAMQLSDGLAQFNKEGIQKLIDKVDDAEVLIERLKATINVSKNYKSFAGISNNADGNVKFIYRTKEIK